MSNSKLLTHRRSSRHFTFTGNTGRKLHTPAGIGLMRIAAMAIAGISWCWADARESSDAAAPLKVHPQVFGLVQCWISDTQSPVVTEFNLEAVEKNCNQFDSDEVAQKDGWIICQSDESGGFKRYRVMEAKDNQYKVEYQENGGGTLTTSSIIECSVNTREISINGKSSLIRVLRVDSCSSK